MRMYSGLPLLQASMFATALEDVLTQFRIIAECNKELHIYKTLNELGKLRRAKFGIEPPKIEDEQPRINPKDLKNEHNKLNKLVQDRKFYMDVLTATYLELALRSAYDPIVEAKQAVHSRYQYYVLLVEEEARSRINSRELNKQVRQQRNRARGLIYDTNLVIEKLRNEVEVAIRWAVARVTPTAMIIMECFYRRWCYMSDLLTWQAVTTDDVQTSPYNVADATLYKEVRSRYIDKWEVTRGEQNTRCIEDKETGSSERIAFYRKQLESEQRAHYEQELHTNILINDILKKLEVWVDKYEDDTANVELKIQIKKLEAKAEKEKREGMEKLLELHALEIKNWMKFKDDRERVIQYQKMMTNAAHVVQAWWRGLLVRLQIGPYRPRRRHPVKPKPEKKK